MSEIGASLTTSDFRRTVFLIELATGAFMMFTVVGFIARVIYKGNVSIKSSYYVFGYNEQESVAINAARGSKAAPTTWLIPRSATAERKVALKCMLKKICLLYEVFLFFRFCLMEGFRFEKDHGGLSTF